MNRTRSVGRGGWKVSDIEAATFAEDLRQWKRSTNSRWRDIVVAAGQRPTSQGWLSDIANGIGPARSGTIAKYRALMAQYPDGVPEGGMVAMGTAAYASPPVSAAEMTRFMRELTDYVRTNSISFSDLARLCGYERRCGSWLQGLSIGRTRPKADTVLRIRRAMNANPTAAGVEPVLEGRPKGEARIAAESAPQGDAPYIPPHIAKQMEIERMRDAAAAARAAHIEACRQAEIARYGRTTIDRDVIECVA